MTVLPPNPRSAKTAYFLDLTLLMLSKSASTTNMPIHTKNAKTPIPTP